MMKLMLPIDASIEVFLYVLFGLVFFCLFCVFLCFSAFFSFFVYLGTSYVIKNRACLDKISCMRSVRSAALEERHTPPRTRLGPLSNPILTPKFRASIQKFTSRFAKLVCNYWLFFLFKVPVPRS